MPLTADLSRVLEQRRALDEDASPGSGAPSEPGEEGRDAASALASAAHFYIGEPDESPMSQSATPLAEPSLSLPLGFGERSPRPSLDCQFREAELRLRVELELSEQRCQDEQARREAAEQEAWHLQQLLLCRNQELAQLKVDFADAIGMCQWRPEQAAEPGAEQALCRGAECLEVEDPEMTRTIEQLEEALVQMESRRVQLEERQERRRGVCASLGAELGILPTQLARTDAEAGVEDFQTAPSIQVAAEDLVGGVVSSGAKGGVELSPQALPDVFLSWHYS